MKPLIAKVKSRRLSPAEDVAHEMSKRDRKSDRKSHRKPNTRAESPVRYDVLGRLCAQRRTRDGLSLRDVERITGVSASTLSRIENGKTVDTEHVAILCKWLGIAIERVAGPIEEDTAQAIKSLLLSDPRLGKHEAEVLCGTLSVLYRQLTKV